MPKKKPKKRTRKTVPTYRLHKSTGQAYVRMDGRMHYLGVHGTADSVSEYQRLLADWQSRQTKAPKGLTVGQLAMLYQRHAKKYYRRAGQSTGVAETIGYALRYLNQHYRKCLAADFGPKSLSAFRYHLIGQNLSRKYINDVCAVVKRMFRWAASEELVSVTVYQGLLTVRILTIGRSDARETDPVRPVSIDHVNAVLPHLSRQVVEMIKLQLLSGCRPAEIVQLRPCDVERSGPVWEYVPQYHKTQHLGKERRIFFGPRAQAVLLPFLDDRPADFPCFSPAEAETERRAKQRENRKTPVQPSQLDRTKPDGQRRPRPAYDTCSYRRAIHRACKLAGIPQWSPNQLRHTRATGLRKEFGVEAAQVVCGHANLNTTLLYAETTYERARQIMLDVG